MGPPFEDKNTKKGPKGKIYHFLKTYTENTSFHGLRYTFEATTTYGRILWFLIVLVFLVWFIYVVAERAIHFGIHPVTVDINVAYNATLHFPSVAICNTNQFRVSKAWDAEIYNKLALFYGTDRQDRREFTILDGMDLVETMKEMAHRKEDMIMKCTWQGGNCSHRDFTPLMTEFGMCYVFNYPDVNNTADDQTFQVQNTGASYGLQLYLNAEVYEQAPGPNLASGIQVLVFDKSDRPRVSDLGIAIPVFEVSRIALHMSSVTRLPDPYGDCDSRSLRDYKVYSYQACMAEFYTNKTSEVCGCIGYGDKWEAPDRPPYCNFSTMYGCYADVNNHPIDHKCTHPCKQEEYSTFLSNTPLSETSINGMLNEFRKDKDLGERYRNAVLTRQMVNIANVKRDITDMLNFIGSHRRLQERIVDPLRETLSHINQLVRNLSPAILSVTTNVRNAAEDVKGRYEDVFKVHALRDYLVPGLAKLGMRAWDLAELILPVMLKPIMFKPEKAEVVSQLKKELVNYFSDALEIINSVTQVFHRIVRKRVSEADTAYEGKTIPRKIIASKKEDITAAIDQLHTSARTLMSKMFEFQILARKLETVTEGSFPSLYGRLMGLAGSINAQLAPEFSTATHKLKKIMEDVGVSVLTESVRVASVVEKLTPFLKSLTDGIRSYKRRMRRNKVKNYEKIFAEIKTKTTPLPSNWTKSAKEYLVKITYPQGKLLLNISRYEKKCLDLNRRLEEIHMKISDNVGVVSDFKSVLDLILVKFPEMANDVRPMLKTLGDFSKQGSKLNDLMVLLKKRTDAFVEYFRILVNSMRDFKRKLQIDEAMIRENMLALQVFYQSLSFTEIIKSPAYGWFSFLSDIGGTAGLFLGGSIITILELLYYIGKTVSQPKVEDVEKAGVPKPDETRPPPYNSAFFYSDKDGEKHHGEGIFSLHV